VLWCWRLRLKTFGRDDGTARLVDLMRRELLRSRDAVVPAGGGDPASAAFDIRVEVEGSRNRAERRRRPSFGGCCSAEPREKA